MILFLARYGRTSQPMIPPASLSVDFAEAEQMHQRFETAWTNATPHTGEVRVQGDVYNLISSRPDGPWTLGYDEPPKDFAKAKTGKAKLEARLQKKAKPPVSKLLASLVKK